MQQGEGKGRDVNGWERKERKEFVRYSEKKGKGEEWIRKGREGEGRGVQ